MNLLSRPNRLATNLILSRGHTTRCCITYLPSDGRKITRRGWKLQGFSACRIKQLNSITNASGVPEDGVKQIAVDSMTDFGITRNARPVKNAGELDELLKQIW